tara:strand:- start:7394 stop:8092 length:699 start_codon:yes stop_codon:yes gene_type:complete
MPEYYEWRCGIPKDHVRGFQSDLVGARWIDTAEDEGAYFHQTFRDFGIVSDPQRGWEKLAYELRLINLTTEDPIRADTPGRVQIARSCDRLAKRLDKTARDIAKLTANNEFLFVNFELRKAGLIDDTTETVSVLHRKARSLETIAEALRSKGTKPKWRRTEAHRQRVVLAYIIAPLFEAEFGQPSRPVGGSASIDLAQTNDWTRFFQAVAFAFWDERETPNRQGVLWAATRL